MAMASGKKRKVWSAKDVLSINTHMTPNLAAHALADLVAERDTLLAQRDAADRAGFERGVREAADVPGRASQKLRDSFGKRRGNQVDRWVADTLSAQSTAILALLAPAAIDEGTTL